MPYTVFIDDNFHYMDESERYALGEFPTLDAAIEASRRVVDDYLSSAYEPGMTIAALLTSYLSFGEDPYIVASPRDPEAPGVLFSARDYARQRCEALCGPDESVDRPGSTVDDSHE